MEREIIIQVVPAIASSLSIVLNTLLIYVAHGRKNSVIGPYRYMIIATSIFDLCFSIVSLIASPTIAAVTAESSVLFVKAGLKMSLSSGRFLLVCWIYLLCLSIVIPPCNFIFRYIQVCRTHLVDRKRVFKIFLVPSLVAVLGATLLGFAAWPSPKDVRAFQNIAFRINTNTTKSFLVASLAPNVGDRNRPLSALKSTILLVSVFYLTIVLIVSVAAMIFCSHHIFVAVRQATSRKTKRQQQQLHRLLIVQCIIPFIFVHMPFYLCCLAPLFKFDTGVVADYLPILFSWSPAINPLVVMTFENT
ncbi:7TM chemoreceptor [Ancylostoma ceylanicum]|uniref:7TM chemoreceptor n=1 Tax=Ancylostoma ceylanicum TaxID=53326 RepID=A0A0D6M1Y9_9BILA|nr:7TM chemoreceptor [Ancylostoma ceylanicum]